MAKKEEKNAVTKTELIDEIAKSAGVSKREVRAVIEVLFNHIGEHLSRGNKVQVTGFGTFEVRERKARTGVRPGTVERIEIPSASYPVFKPSKSLTDRTAQQGLPRTIDIRGPIWPLSPGNLSGDITDISISRGLPGDTTTDAPPPKEDKKSKP
jgi:DNA-binding protein HU-beta